MAVITGWEGRYFEDFTVGDVYRCRVGRTVTENDNIWFTLLTNNTNQIHFNNEYGKRTEFGKCLINSALTLAIVAGMGVADVSRERLRPGLGPDPAAQPAVRRRHPLLRVRGPGEARLQIEAAVGASSRSAPGACSRRARWSSDYARSVMVWRKAHAPRRGHLPGDH